MNPDDKSDESDTLTSPMTQMTIFLVIFFLCHQPKFDKKITADCFFFQDLFLIVSLTLISNGKAKFI